MAQKQSNPRTQAPQPPAKAPAIEVLTVDELVGNAELGRRLGVSGPPAGGATVPPPTGGNPLDPSLLAAAEKAFGMSVGSVDARTGDGVAESMGAAAVTVGNRIHVATAAICKDGLAEPGLIAHELTHIFQQNSAAPASSGVDMEAEADAGANAILSGSTLSLSGSTGGQATPQKLDFSEWFRRSVLAGDTITETDAVDTRTQTPDTYYGTSMPIDTGTPANMTPNSSLQTTPTSGGLYQESVDVTRGGRTTTNTMQLHDGRDSSSVVSSEGFNLMDGTRRSSTVMRSSQDQGVDHTATATALQQEIRNSAEGVQTRIDDTNRRLQDTRTGLTDATAREQRERQRVSDAIRARTGEAPTAQQLSDALTQDETWTGARFAQRRLQSAQTRLSGEQEQLTTRHRQLTDAAAQVTPENAASIAQQTGVNIEAVRVAPTVQEASMSRVQDVNLLGGSATQTDTARIHRSDANGSDTLTRENSNAVTVGGGIRNDRSQTDTVAVTVGGNTYENRNQNTTSGGLVVGANGEVGGQFGRNSSNRTTRVEGGQRRVTETGSGHNTTVTNNAIGHSRNANARVEGNHLDAGAKVSGDGKVTVTCTKISDNPLKYRLAVIIRAGANVALSSTGTTTERGDRNAAQQNRGNAGVNAGAGASIQLTYNHELDQTAAGQYLDQLAKYEAGSPTSGSAPEFDLLDRMTLLGDDLGDGAANQALAAFDSRGSRDIQPGSSYELMLTGEASVGGNAGANQGGSGGLAVGVSGGMDWQRTRKVQVGAVQHEGRRLTTLTVGFASRDGWNANGNMSYGAAGASGGHREQERSGLSYTFRLDPEMDDYDRVYDRIIGTATREGLRALGQRPDIVRHRTGHTDTQGTTTTDTVGMSVGPVAVGLATENQYDQSVTVDERGLQGTITGSETNSGNIAVGGVRLHEDSERTSGTGTVNADGELNIRLEQTESSNSIANLGDENAAADKRGWAERLLGQSPKASLQKELRDTLTHVWGLSIDEAALDVIVRRAGDESNWNKCANWQNVDDFNAWKGVRRRLRSPRPDADWAQVDPVRAAKLDQARVVARFMENTGRAGLAMFRNVMRSWGEDMNSYQQGAEDVGMMFEWPEGLQTTRPKYDSIQARLDTIDTRVTGALGLPEERTNSVLEWFAKLGTDITSVRNTIVGYTAFDLPRAKMEMVSKLDENRLTWTEWRARLTGGSATCTPEQESEIETARLLRQRERLKSQLRQFKKEQDRLLTNASNASFDDAWDNADGFFASAGVMFGIGEPEHESISYLSNCWDMQTYWIPKVVELRGVYEATGIAQDDWHVSTGPGADRDYAYEPAFEELNRLWLLEQWDKHAAKIGRASCRERV